MAKADPADETTTQLLHRLTSYEPGRDWEEAIEDPRLVQDFVGTDIDRLPYFYKRYADGLPTIELPRELPGSSHPAVGVLAGTAVAARAKLDLDTLGRLLYLSAGVVRTAQRPYAVWLFRAAGSAGGRFPLELYVSVPEGHGVPAGVHWYHPEAHALVTIGPPPRGGDPTLVVTGVPWRTGWRYRERGFRHVYWDAGTMLAQLLALADSSGLQPSLFTAFPDRTTTELVGADGVDEWPVAVVALGPRPAIEPTGAAATGAIDGAPMEFPLVTKAQHAGDADALGAAWARGDPAELPLRDGPPLDDVILRRGSQRLMDPEGRLPRAFLESSMLAAMRGIDVPHFVAAHRVDGLEPGLYRWPDLGVPVRRGDLRDELYVACLEQGLGSDAVFVAIGVTDIGALDDHAYREAQLAAGLVEGRLHLMAYALGAGASGMTFDDSTIPALLGEDLDGLLFTCVGVPEYASKPGGRPGEPVDVRLVTPRTSD
jgi:hypothetical protein